MRKNSFLIEDILENRSKPCQDEFKGFKKRALIAQQNEQQPSISPASSSSDDNNNLDLEYLKQQYLKQAYPALIFNQYMSSNPIINDKYTSNSAPDYNNLLMSSILQGYSANNDESLQLLTNYYTKLFSNQNTQNTFPSYDCDSNRSKRLKLNESIDSKFFPQNTIYNLDESRLKDPLNLSKHNSKLNYNMKKDSVSNSSTSPSSSLSPKSNESIENVSPLDALLQLANNTFVNRAGLIATKINTGTNYSEDQMKSKIFSNKNDDEDLVIESKTQISNPSSNTSFDSLNESNSKSSSTTKSINVKTAPASSSASSNTASANALKRKRKNRTAFTANQIFELEKRFSSQRYLSPHDRDRIAYELQLSTAQVITWFQNRRAKQKRDLEELKNDVNAAKTLKVIDPDLDVEKIIRTTASENDATSTSSHKFKSDLEKNNNDHLEDDQYTDADLEGEEEEIDIDNESVLSNSVNDEISSNSADNSVSSPKF